MNLTLHTDYSLRILLYLAEHADRPVATREINQPANEQDRTEGHAHNGLQTVPRH